MTQKVVTNDIAISVLLKGMLKKEKSQKSTHPSV
jgi:hypothetical protein